MATFLSLTNDAIRESGSDIDTLSTVILTGNTQQARFCNWVSQAWHDIQTETTGWEFLKSRGVYTIVPRFHFFDGTTAFETTTSMEDIVLTDAQASNPETLTINYFSPASGSAISTPTAGWIELKVDPDSPIDFKIPVGSKWTTPSGGTGRTFAGYFHHWGRYDLYDNVGYDLVSPGFSTDLSDIASIDWTTLKMQDDAFIGEAWSNGREYMDSKAIDIEFMPYSFYSRCGYEKNAQPGTPKYVTETPDGLLQMYPPPNKNYVITFDYVRTPQTLTDDADTPTGLPARHQQVIVWKAVMEYALFDEQPALKAKAERRYNELMVRLRRDALPKISIGHKLGF